jgi:hypothetical protein
MQRCLKMVSSLRQEDKLFRGITQRSAAADGRSGPL